MEILRTAHKRNDEKKILVCCDIKQ